MLCKKLKKVPFGMVDYNGLKQLQLYHHKLNHKHNKKEIQTWLSEVGIIMVLIIYLIEPNTFTFIVPNFTRICNFILTYCKCVGTLKARTNVTIMNT